MEERLRNAVLEVHACFADAGFECYMVGGIVRDLLLGRPPGDVDFATNARPDAVQKLFRRTVPTGIKHGTISVLFDGFQFEVTTYRAEKGYSDARHPDEVRFADTLSQDLERRDFTINALAFDPGQKQLLDMHEGLADLSQGLIRTIGRPRDRFFEDGLRPIRACRFAATLDFDIEPATEDALADPEVHRRTRLVAVERFADELWKGMGARHVSAMIRHLEKSRLLYLFFPRAVGLVPQTTAACFADLEAMADYPAVMKMACWWDDLGFFETRVIRTVAHSLRFSNQDTRDVEWYCRYYSFQKSLASDLQEELDDEAARTGSSTGPIKLIPGIDYRSLVSEERLEQFLTQPLIDYRIRRFLSELKQNYRTNGVEFLRRASNLPLNQVPVSRLIQVYEREPLTIADLKIDGNELMNLGLSGPMIGETLRLFLDAVLRDPSRNDQAYFHGRLKSRVD